jgi:hypothetical protein
MTRNTLRDFELWIQDHKGKTGKWGFREFLWLHRHFLGKIFLVGRLQFELSSFQGNFHVFHNPDGNRTITLSGHNNKFREDGQFEDAKGFLNPDKAWISSFTENADSAEGQVVSPLGSTLKKTVRLYKKDWIPVLTKGDPALHVHIPAQGPYHGSFDTQAIDESFTEASTFFQKHFSDFGYKAFLCTSWLLDGQLAGFLPANSNIIRFQNRFYLLPLLGATDTQTLERVFGAATIDLTTAPRDTSLRRAILSHMEKRGFWRMGTGFCLKEHAGAASNLYQQPIADIFQ